MRITAEQFRDARVFAGMTREQAACFLNVGLRTVGHWETGKARPAWTAFKLLRLYRHGDLIDPRWAGYSLIRGRLVTPENHSFEPGDLSWLSLLVRRARAFSGLLAARDAFTAPPPAAREATRAASVRAGGVAGSTGDLPRSFAHVPPLSVIIPPGEPIPTAFQTFSPVLTGEKGQPWGVIGPGSNTGQKGQGVRA